MWLIPFLPEEVPHDVWPSLPCPVGRPSKKGNEGDALQVAPKSIRLGYEEPPFSEGNNQGEEEEQEESPPQEERLSLT